MKSDTFVEGKAKITGNLLLSLYSEDNRKDPSFLSKYLQKLLFFNDGLSSFLLSDPPDYVCQAFIFPTRWCSLFVINQVRLF